MTASKPEAFHEFTSSQADAVLSGAKTAPGEFAEVAPVLDALRVAGRAVPVPSRVDAIATALASAAIEAAPIGALPRQSRSTIKRSSVMKARTRIASATGAAIALALGSTGVAAAAEDTLPGDPFYGLKRALENVGIYEGGLDERVEESLALAEQGDDEDAVEHLADSLEEEGDVLEEEGDEETAEELRNAAEAVLSGGSENSLAVRTAVAEMLQWMADTDLEGRDFGQGVAERARAIGGPKDKGDDEVIEDGDETVVEDGDETVVEDGDETVVEDEKGKSADAGKSEGKGKPSHAGPPEGKGRPEGAGRP
jgi:hypothetical protein